MRCSICFVVTMSVARDEYIVAWECIVSSYIDTASLCRLSTVSRWFERLVVQQRTPKTQQERVDYKNDVLRWYKPTQGTSDSDGLWVAIYRSFNVIYCGPNEAEIPPWFPLLYAHTYNETIRQSMPFKIEWLALRENAFVENMLVSQYGDHEAFERASAEFKALIYTTNIAGERVLRRSRWFPRFSALYVIACCAYNTHPYLAAAFLDMNIEHELFREQVNKTQLQVFDRQHQMRTITIPCTVDGSPSVYTVTMPEQRSRMNWELLKRLYAQKMAHVAAHIQLDVHLHAMNQTAMSYLDINGGGIMSVSYSYMDLHVKVLRKNNRYACVRFGIQVDDTSTPEEVALRLSHCVKTTMLHEYAYSSKHLTCSIPFPKPYIDVHNVVSHGPWYHVIDHLYTYWDRRLQQKRQTYVDMARDGYQQMMDTWTTRSKRRKRTLEERAHDTRAAAAEVLHSRPAKKQKTMKQQTLE